MKIYFTKTIFLFFLSTLFYSCANITSPTGGAKDVTAPKLKNRSVKDSLLNYTGGKIQFEFDEFIQLKDVQNQLVVTPLLKNKPLVTSHKKTVSIYLADSLLEKIQRIKYHLAMLFKIYMKATLPKILDLLFLQEDILTP